MTLGCRSLGALLALTLLVAGCGGSARPSRPAPAPQDRVTATEKRVIERWADGLSHGDVRAASAQFSVPSEIVNLQPDVLELDSARRVEDFNDSLPCGAKVIKISRSDSRLVVGEFELTDRPGGDCGTTVGSRATFAFLINSGGHITRLIYLESGETEPPPDTTLT